jgi:hypothetical protein
MKVKNFDIHVVANHLPIDLEKELRLMGYSAKQVVGGDERVRMQHLLSMKVDDRRNADRVFNLSVSAIEDYPSFSGYIESEAVSEDFVVRVPDDGGRKAEDFPQRLIVSPCPPGRYKKCDIHVAIPTGNGEVTAKLRDAGFYYLGLDKPGIGSFNIVTIQLEDMGRGKLTWKTLLDYLHRCGGFEGFVKFEVTVNIKNFGFLLPPMVLKERSPDSIPSTDSPVN